MTIGTIERRIGMPRTAQRPGPFMPIWRWMRAAALIIAYAALGFSYAWPAVMPTPLAIFAHRGDIAHWPENTLQSVMAAKHMGVDGIEIDVRKSADGTWWLFHDATLDRTTGSAGLVSARSDSQLEEVIIRAGPGYHGQSDVHLARLDTTLAALTDFSGSVIFDVKESDPASHAEIARIAPAGSLVICRSVEGSAAVKREDSSLTTLMLTNEVWHPDVDVWLLEAGNDDSWPRSSLADALGTAAAFVNVETERGRSDEIALLENARRSGIAFIISNDPGNALTWRRNQP